MYNIKKPVHFSFKLSWKLLNHSIICASSYWLTICHGNNKYKSYNISWSAFKQCPFILMQKTKQKKKWVEITTYRTKMDKTACARQCFWQHHKLHWTVCKPVTTHPCSCASGSEGIREAKCTQDGRCSCLECELISLEAEKVRV